MKPVDYIFEGRLGSECRYAPLKSEIGELEPYAALEAMADPRNTRSGISLERAEQIHALFTTLAVSRIVERVVSRDQAIANYLKEHQES